MVQSPTVALKPPTYADVQRAAQTLEGVAHRTPVLTSQSLNKSLGAEVFFKCESFQRTGAFKFRGAYNALSNLSTAHKKAGVVAYSSGNHAQAIALSGQLLGISTTIVMPHDAPVPNGRPQRVMARRSCFMTGTLKSATRSRPSWRSNMVWL